MGSAIGSRRSVVGTLWSGVATVSCGRRTLRSGNSQAFKRLRAGHFVHQVQIDIQDRLLRRLGMHDVGVPDLLEHRPWIRCAVFHGHSQ